MSNDVMIIREWARFSVFGRVKLCICIFDFIVAVDVVVTKVTAGCFVFEVWVEIMQPEKNGFWSEVRSAARFCQLIARSLTGCRSRHTGYVAVGLENRNIPFIEPLVEPIAEKELMTGNADV